MTRSNTERGFPVYNFLDYYRRDCILQLSSIADARCIWLGGDKDPMHLTAEQVKEIIPILQRFVETGDIVENG